MKKMILLVWLGIIAKGEAQTVGKIRLTFPPMPINRIAIGLMEAQKEPFTGTITLEDGSVFEVTRASIPATFVRGHGTFYTVDACVGTGDVNGGNIVIDLPPEPVRLRHGVMTALAITAAVTVTLANGQVGVGTLYFPDCPTTFIEPGHFLASEVIATGSVTFP